MLLFASLRLRKTRGSQVSPMGEGKASPWRRRERFGEDKRGAERDRGILERVLFQRSPKRESIGFSAGFHGDREANRTVHAISDEDVERASPQWRKRTIPLFRFPLPFPVGEIT